MLNYECGMIRVKHHISGWIYKYVFGCKLLQNKGYLIGRCLDNNILQSVLILLQYLQDTGKSRQEIRYISKVTLFSVNHAYMSHIIKYLCGTLLFFPVNWHS